MQEWVMAGEATLEGNLGRRTFFRWHRNEIFDENWNMFPDPNDNPPETLKLLVTYYAGASAASDLASIHHDPDYESAYAEISGQTKTGVDNGVSATGASISGKRLIEIEVNGQDLVPTPWLDAHVIAELAGDRFVSGQPIEGVIGIGMGYSAQEDSRSIQISSSTIEDSYYRESGQPALDAQYRLTAPHPPAPPPYSIKNKRNADGSMVVDSAATWFDGSSGETPGWYGGGIFTANTPNFSSPTREWSLTGGVPTTYADAKISAGYQSITLPNDVDGTVFPPVVRGIRLGGLQQIDPIPDNQSTLTLKVTDTDGAVGENTYTVNWHKPYENWTKTSETYMPPLNLSLNNTKVSSSAQLYYSYESNKVDFDFGTTLAVGSAFLGGTATIVSVAPGGQGVGAALGIASAVAGGASVVIGSPPPPEPPHQVPQSDFSYTQYKAAVTAANNNQTYGDGQEYYLTPGITGLARTNLLSQVIASFTTNSNGNGDSEYEYNTYVTGKAIAVPLKKNWLGDHYDANGYVGANPGHSIHPEGVPAIQITWQYDDGTP
jgi:hypothetical protein